MVLPGLSTSPSVRRTCGTGASTTAAVVTATAGGPGRAGRERAGREQEPRCGQKPSRDQERAATARIAAAASRRGDVQDDGRAAALAPA